MSNRNNNKSSTLSSIVDDGNEEEYDDDENNEYIEEDLFEKYQHNHEEYDNINDDDYDLTTTLSHNNNSTNRTIIQKNDPSTLNHSIIDNDNNNHHSRSRCHNGDNNDINNDDNISSSNSNNIEDINYNEQKRVIMSTADDAIYTKHATIQAGYYNDLYINIFYQYRFALHHNRPPVQVIIKRGTLARIVCIEKCITHFIYESIKQQKNPNQTAVITIPPNHKSNNIVSQIIIVGSGFDTCFFRLFDNTHNNKANNDDEKKDQCDVKQRLLSSLLSLNKTNNDDNNIVHRNTIQWIEIDHYEIIHEKIRMIQKYQKQQQNSSSSLFSGKVIQHQTNSTTIPVIYEYQVNHSIHPDENSTTEDSELENNSQHNVTMSCYYIPHDLQNDPISLFDLLRNNNDNQLRYNIDTPTLIVMECIQMYIPIQQNKHFITLLHEYYNHITLCSYEPILDYDPFGKMMEINFYKAGYIINKNNNNKHQKNHHSNKALPSSRSDDNHHNETDDETDSNDDNVNNSSMVLQYRTIIEYMKYYKSCGYNIITGCNMYQAYETIIPNHIRYHALKCELLDELEEFILLMKHYCYIIATTSTTNHNVIPESNTLLTTTDNIDNNESHSTSMTIGETLCTVMKFDPKSLVTKNNNDNENHNNNSNDSSSLSSVLGFIENQCYTTTMITKNGKLK